MIAPEGGRDAVFMRSALAEAVAAGAAGEVPVGAVLVRGEDIIATGANKPRSACCPPAPAQTEALRAPAPPPPCRRRRESSLPRPPCPCACGRAAVRRPAGP